jgi:molybdopterin-guanine dinucleotide biosynthesis protein A
MGRDKAAVSVDGRPMIERAVAALRPHCVDVIVVSGRPGTPAGSWRVVRDRRPPCGPLGGVETALAQAASGGFEAVAVLAVDLPLVDAHGIGVLRAGRSGSRAAAAARAGDPPFEPLCAVYPVGSLATATRLLDEGERAARALFAALDGDVVDGVAGVSLNVNEPADVARAEEELR